MVNRWMRELIYAETIQHVFVAQITITNIYFKRLQNLCARRLATLSTDDLNRTY